MKQFRILSMLMIVLISSLSFVSCGDDDDETSGDFSASIAGVYTGTNVTADAYVVTVTKVSSSVVKVTADFYTDNGSENYNVTKEGNQYILSSESSSGINITVTGKAMTISFLNNAGSMTTFTGTRD
jgi:uncharacterized lipoprotein YehR (DUF1307 family)